MSKLTLIKLEVNSWNGFILLVMGIEINNFEGELLGLHFSKDYLARSIFFVCIEIKSPFT